MLKALLSDTGRVYLRNRKLEGWTVAQALHDLSYLLGKPLHDPSVVATGNVCFGLT